MTHEQKLKLSLLLLNLCFSSLLGFALQPMSGLFIVSSLVVAAYLQIWLSWKVWRFFTQPVMQLTAYTQALREGEHNLRFDLGPKEGHLTELLREIDLLAQQQKAAQQENQKIEHLISTMLAQWQQPVCLFDQQLKLIFSNQAATDYLAQPLLRGTPASQLGFQLEEQSLNHSEFDAGWQCQTLKYRDRGEDFWLFNAIYLADVINRAEILSQKNLVRVLSHELRNSLTPMASLTDTLLNASEFKPQQTRMVLERIKHRSEHLLSFIQEYAKLSQLPTPKQTWFDFSGLLNEIKATLPETAHLEFIGDHQCFGDPGLLSQVLINLLKNAAEASEESAHITLKQYQDANKQYLEVKDKGPGFANLDNVFTPFYTTKSQGSGIGLALSAEIICRHGGDITASNDQGAVLKASWPLH